VRTGRARTVADEARRLRRDDLVRRIMPTKRISLIDVVLTVIIAGMLAAIIVPNV
jgi:hypothetical protein